MLWSGDVTITCRRPNVVKFGLPGVQAAPASPEISTARLMIIKDSAFSMKILHGREISLQNDAASRRVRHIHRGGPLRDIVAGKLSEGGRPGLGKATYGLARAD
jgi:hypothetical protein